MNRPLEAIRVLDLGISTAGPYAARFLGDLGAEVIKVEPLDGENSRKLSLRYGGVGYLYHVNNYNKKSITLQVQHPRGRAILLDLVATSDVLIENFSCGTMDKWGVGYEACRARNPGIIYASAKGFGETGPLRDRRAFDTVVQAMSGIMASTGEPPVKAGPSACDLMTASLVAMAVTASVAARRPGESQFLDCAMFDMGAWSQLPLWPEALGQADAPAGYGFTGQYACTDGSLALEITRPAHRETLDRFLQCDPAGEEDLRAWTSTRAAFDAAAQLQAAGIPAAPVWDLKQLHDSGLLAERGMVREHTHPVYGAVPLIQSPIARAGFGGDGVWRDQPTLGEHTAEILGALGCADELPALRADGVIA